TMEEIMKRMLCLFAIVSLMAIWLCSCSDENSAGPSQATVPEVSTTSVSVIKQTTAECGGTVTSDGGAAVTERGVCWGTSTIPTTANSRTTDGTGMGSYSSSLTGLTPGTKYYVRAYATNEVGTGYGVTDSLTTVSLLQITSSFDTDAEGWVVVGEGGLYYHNNNGHPGGYIEFEDWEAMPGGFLAPDKFKGDLSAYSGGTLSFDLKNTVNNGNGALGTYGMIRLISGTLYAENNPVPYPSYLSEWTTFSIPLTADEWVVTPAQWDSILANVTELQILMDPQGDFYDRSALDNFTFTAPLQGAEDLDDQLRYTIDR
ncbi:MAG: hypothetical protein JXA92_07920, partial [candidate division Zixibacteria bacterium]|nr:hypothetical protein [candidate division Zixibacteria bacterium]